LEWCWLYDLSDNARDVAQLFATVRSSIESATPPIPVLEKTQVAEVIAPGKYVREYFNIELVEDALVPN
jgi:hypothetical protein